MFNSMTYQTQNITILLGDFFYGVYIGGELEYDMDTLSVKELYNIVSSKNVNITFIEPNSAINEFVEKYDSSPYNLDILYALLEE